MSRFFRTQRSPLCAICHALALVDKSNTCRGPRAKLPHTAFKTRLNCISTGITDQHACLHIQAPCEADGTHRTLRHYRVCEMPLALENTIVEQSMYR